MLSFTEFVHQGFEVKSFVPSHIANEDRAYTDVGRRGNKKRQCLEYQKVFWKEEHLSF